MESSRESSQRKLGILYLATATLPPLGADVQVHARILRSLDRSTHDLHAACAPGPVGAPTPTLAALREIPDLRLVDVNLGPELSVRSAWGKMRGLIATLPAIGGLMRLASYIRHNQIDIIHTGDRPRDAAAGVLLARLTHARCVIHCHNGYDTWMSRLLRWSLQRADARIGVSDAVTESYVSSGHDAASTFTVHNAIDIGEWEPRRGRSDARAELGISERAPTAIMVCRLFPSKGPAELIRAIAEVRREISDVRLVIVGRDLALDGSLTRELSALVDELALADHVIFTGHRADVPRLMVAADIFAMPSVWEPFGLVYAEAMAMELPVVALDSGGTPEVVEHGRTGLLSAPGDDDALARNILELLQDDELRMAMGRRGRQRVAKEFRPDRQADETARIFRSVASARLGGTNRVKGGGPWGPEHPLTSSELSTP